MGLGLDRGKAFGSKYDGKVARKVMEATGETYNGYHVILKMNENERSTMIDQYIDDL